jgi:hypothetical protein
VHAAIRGLEIDFLDEDPGFGMGAAQVKDEMDEPEEGVAEHARCQLFHDAAVIDGHALWPCGKGLVVSGPVFGHVLAQFVYGPLVDDAMGSHGSASNFVKGDVGQTKGISMLDVGSIERSEDTRALFGALMVAAGQLSRQVKGHGGVAVIHKRVGGPMGEGMLPAGPEGMAAEQFGQSGDGPELGPGGEDGEGLLEEEASKAPSFGAKECPVAGRCLCGGLEYDGRGVNCARRETNEAPDPVDQEGRCEHAVSGGRSGW